MAPRIARELRHPDAGRGAARLRRLARSAAGARSRRRRERPRCGVRGRALQAAHAGGVRAYRHRSIALVDAQTAPVRAPRRADCAAPSRSGRHHSRTRRGRQARDLPAASLGGLARSGAVHRTPQAKSRDCAEHRYPALPGEALHRAQVARGGASSMSAVRKEPYIGRWWHTLEDGRLQCDLCPRDCRLHEGQRGACFVRMREHDKMVLTTYGRSSGFCIDPVEKKPLNHFYPGSSILSFGTAGCNLACKFCQNWDISKSRDVDTLVYLEHETEVWFEITTLLIPGRNDGDEEIDAECRWIAKELGPGVPLHFTAFHPDYKMTDIPPTPAATLTRARKIALGHGLRYVYTGNVHDPEGGSTYCPGCGSAVIARDWYSILDYRVTGDGKCKQCGAEIPGRFEEFKKSFGPRRIPVRLGLA